MEETEIYDTFFICLHILGQLWTSDKNAKTFQFFFLDIYTDIFLFKFLINEKNYPNQLPDIYAFNKMMKWTFKHELSFSHFQIKNLNFLKQIHAYLGFVQQSTRKHLPKLPEISLFTTIKLKQVNLNIHLILVSHS